MKRISIQIICSVLTFLVGVSLTAYWIFNSSLPTVSAPESETIRASNFGYDTELTVSERKFWEKEIFPRFRDKPLKSYIDDFDETYRMILLPTFNKPLMIQLSRQGNEKILTIKKLSGQGGFGIKKFGKLEFEKTLPLSETQWNTFLGLLNKAYFHDLPTLDRNEEPVNDGAEWIIEGLQNKEFHDVHRITPNKELSELYEYLLKITGLNEEYDGYLSGKYSS